MSDLDDTLESIELTEWLDHLNLDHRGTSNGDNLQLRVCPVCHDDRWRVYFNRDTKLGMCFHAECRKKFNLFSLARATLGGDARGTIVHFEDYAVRVLRRPPRARASLRPPVALVGALCLPESVAIPTPTGHTHPYLLARSILPATQALFGVRWCENGAWAYEDLDETRRSMWFGKRILLPICDLDGTVKTFVGRDATGVAQLRYLFPPMLPSASRFLYGGELAGEAEHLVIGEGPFDAIAIHQALAHPDFRQHAALGTFGISLGHGDQAGDDQFGRLIRLRRGKAQRATMLWDGEANALREALNAAELLTRNGIPTAIGLLPQDTDPGEVDTATIRRAVSDAKLYDARLRMLYTLKSPYG